MNYPWRCVCGEAGSGEASAQRHAGHCPRFGWPNTNPYMDAYNAGTRRAIAANRAARLYADGICGTCGTRKRSEGKRTCAACRKKGHQ
jgi:hypothetical protein